MKRLNYRDTFIFFLATLFLGACSQTPSVSDGKKIFEKAVQEQSHGLIKGVNFNKTNGAEGKNMEGIKSYRMEFEAELEFMENGYWGGPFGGFEVIRGEPGPFNAFMFIGKNRANKGQRTKITGTLNFVKTEKGWIGELRGE